MIAARRSCPCNALRHVANHKLAGLVKKADWRGGAAAIAALPGLKVGKERGRRLPAAVVRRFRFWKRIAKPINLSAASAGWV